MDAAYSYPYILFLYSEYIIITFEEGNVYK